MRKQIVFFFLTGVLLFLFTSETAFSGDKVLTMSTTTSTQASGLLDILLPEFQKDTGITVKVIAKGTGAAIRDGMDGNVDVIFVHAKAREEKFVKDGYGTKRYAVMYNDFVILGPAGDPAGIKGTTDAADALSKIAGAKAGFISRGDDSGTHTREQALWEKTGLPMKNTTTKIMKKGQEGEINSFHPEGSWYHSIGQGMGKTITYADEKLAYTLADRGTYIKYKHGRKQSIDLVVLCEGDPLLNNPYGIIPVDPKKHPHVKYDMAKQFAGWLVSQKGQKLIAEYRLLGKQLFYPDAIK